MLPPSGGTPGHNRDNFPLFPLAHLPATSHLSPLTSHALTPLVRTNVCFVAPTPLPSPMDVLQTLAVALGLAALSGYSLYLTVFLTGLAVHFDWIHLAPQYASLSVLADPAIIIISGILFVIEFFVDKIPWLDSLWDAIHTVIRPIGGALLAIQALGHPGPVFNVVIGLIAGAVTFTSHSVKTGTRLIVNQSPEPFSNVAVSLGENLLVGATFALLWSHPIPALIILVILFSVAFYFLPRIWRTIRMRVWFIRQKMKQPARRTAVELLADLPGPYERWFRKLVQPQQTVRWAVPCIAGKGKLIPRDQFGYLTATEEQLAMVFFLVKGWFGQPNYSRSRSSSPRSNNVFFSTKSFYLHRVKPIDTASASIVPKPAWHLGVRRPETANGCIPASAADPAWRTN